MILINPATEERFEHPGHDAAEVDRRVRAASAAFGPWSGTPLAERARVLSRAARLLRERRGAYGAIMTREMGKPIAAAEAEVDKCADACDYFAQHAARMLRPELHESDAAESFVRFDPLGPVLAIMPWNFPFWQAVRFAAPALVAGNVGLLKHAPNVPSCATALEAVFRDAGAPAGVFAALLVADNAAAERLVAHPVVRAVTLTGSERAGSAVAAAAGRALKKTVMELGGSDAFVVLDDVDVDEVAQAAAAARCINSGQSCIAAKRFIVVEAIADRFERGLTSAMAALKVGDPTDRSTDLGPLARIDLLENIDRQVRATVAAGARLLAGGHRVGDRGYFYAPTVLADVRPGMAAFDEETFGPVAAVIRAANVDDAVRLANQSSYGLGAGVWTKDVALARSLAQRLDVGNVFVNGPVKSDPRLPFGGVKNSGWGRELSTFGIREFVNVKTVWIR